MCVCGGGGRLRVKGWEGGRSKDKPEDNGGKGWRVLVGRGRAREST